MVIVVGRLQQLYDRKACFKRSLSLRLRAVHSRCAVASHIPHVAPVVVESEAFSHLQHRNGELGTERQLGH